MTNIGLGTLASATPMGQHQYETQLMRHLPTVAPDLRGHNVRVRTLRSALHGEARLPLRATSRLPQSVQHMVARVSYGHAALAHRCDFRLPAAGKEVVTVDDLAPLRLPDEGEIAASAIPSLRAAQVVTVPSEFAARELRVLLGVDGAVVIPNGIADDIWDPSSDPPALQAAVDAPARFVLHAGGSTARKNLAGLAWAWAWAKVSARQPDVGLLLRGPPDDRRTTVFAGQPRVRLLGPVPRTTLLALTSAAEVVVVPSTYEGFGFLALEATARGTAVVAADCARFTWEHRAHEHADVIRSAAS